MDRPFGSSVTGSAFLCSVGRCDEIATIVVDHHNRAESPLCGEHWQTARHLTGDRLSTITILPRPRCFVAGCGESAIEIVVHLDGTLLPCCERHLEDLSWVTPKTSTCDVGDV